MASRYGRPLEFGFSLVPNTADTSQAPSLRSAPTLSAWISSGSRTTRTSGVIADGWVPSLGWAPPELVPDMQRRIDEGAQAASRDPSEIRRVYNINGTILDGSTRGLLEGSPSHWIKTLESFAGALGFDTFILWPGEEPLAQIERFAEEVAPALR